MKSDTVEQRAIKIFLSLMEIEKRWIFLKIFSEIHCNNVK